MARPKSFVDSEPDTVDVLNVVSLNQFIGPLRQRREMYGQDPYEFYIDLFGDQGKRPNTTAKKTEYGFNLPWAMQLKNLIRRYAAMPEKFQRFIVAAKQDGVTWRGEDLNHFKAVCDETMDYMAMKPIDKGKYRYKMSKRMGLVSRTMTS